MSFRPRLSAMSLVASLALAFGANTTKAELIEIGSSTVSGKDSATNDNVSAKVDFYYNTTSTNTLIVDLRNTTTGGTLSPLDVLTGLVFNISGSPQYATSPSSANLSPSLSITGDGTTSTELGSGSFANSWTNSFTSGGNSDVNGGYGISTTGYNGAFASSNLGGLTSPNYGIVGTGTNASNSNFLTYNEPLAVNALEFSLTFKTAINAATLSNIQFLFGSDSCNFGADLAGSSVVLATPEPSTFAIAGLGALGFFGYSIHRRRRAV